jgi:geranylgeranyl diphosphate synthase type II
VNDAPTLESYLKNLRREIDGGLERALGSIAAPELVARAMRYSLLSGGKRLRPSLTLAAAEATGDPLGVSASDARAMAMPAAIAVEMIHTYSLIHDDLPAMDDDALRRGQPTSHVVHGDGLAILAGDGLLTEAFGMLARDVAPKLPPGVKAKDYPLPQKTVERIYALADGQRRLKAIATLAAAAGAAGMVGGQAIDLAAAGRVPGAHQPVTEAAALEDMHARKTGALIRAAATTGAILVGAAEATVAAIDAYARDLGLAFQIIDDVLDVEGSNEALGKTPGKDAASGKPTYPSRYGVTESRRLAASAVERAQSALAQAGVGGRLSDIAAWSLSRRA